MGEKNTEEVVYDCLFQLLQPLITKYEKGDYIDCEIKNKDVISNAKLPVWVFWWQGLDEAPQIVKWCVQSMKRNISSANAKIYIITEKNISEYISFPKYIKEKFDDKKISITHLSDIIRTHLLYLYGGLWLDATYYIADQRINDIIAQPGFYTQKFGENAGRNDLVNGRWSCSMMKSKKGFPLFGFLMEAFYIYWKQMDRPVSYFFFDDLIALAYDHIQIIQDEMKKCPINNLKTFQLMEICNTTYKQSHYDELIKDTFLFKMTYKMDAKQTNILGEPSFYGYLLQNK